jgi:general secretion pathway protein H
MAGRPSDQRGFTLIELLVTLGIMALAIAIGLPALSGGSASLDARTAAEQIAAALRATRAEAIAAGKPADFTIDLASQTYNAGGQPRKVAVSGDIHLALYTTDDRAGQQGGAIRFYPDGGASGGGVSVAAGGRTVLVAVDWLAGRVSVNNKKDDDR